MMIGHNDLTTSKSVKLVWYLMRPDHFVKRTNPAAISACDAMKRIGMEVSLRTWFLTTHDQRRALAGK
jgi:hypothetical protein